MQEAIAIANQEQIRVSMIDVADPFVVGACKDQISHVLEEFADVVFMNADEAHALLGCGPEEAAKLSSEDVEHVIVKTGASGSLVAHGGHIHRIGIHPHDCTRYRVQETLTLPGTSTVSPRAGTPHSVAISGRASPRSRSGRRVEEMRPRGTRRRRRRGSRRTV